MYITQTLNCWSKNKPYENVFIQETYSKYVSFEYNMSYPMIKTSILLHLSLFMLENKYLYIMKGKVIVVKRTAKLKLKNLSKDF